MLEAAQKKLMSLINKTKSGCWEWTRSLNPGGYGQTYFDGKYYIASRLSYMAFQGDIPKGMFVCHKCDNPKCINPEHLFLGTPKDNTQDCLSKNRHYASQKNPLQKRA